MRLRVQDWRYKGVETSLDAAGRSACATAVSVLWVAAALFAAEQPKKPLAIVNAALLEAEDGFAAPADAVYQPGETLYLAFNVQGYTPDRNNKVKLTYSIDALDFKRIPFVPPDTGKVETELSPQDAKWMPRVRFSPSLPPFADSGKYKFV